MRILLQLKFKHTFGGGFNESYYILDDIADWDIFIAPMWFDRLIYIDVKYDLFGVFIWWDFNICLEGSTFWLNDLPQD